MKVWLCSDGSYSDWHPTAIYSDEATAKRVTEAYGWDNAPDEYELDPEVPQEARAGMSFFSVLMWDNGDVHYVSKTERDAFTVNGEFHNSTNLSGRTGRQFFTYCWASDEQHAVKIANERRAQMLALESPERR